MKTIYLHGSLKKRYPAPIKVHASTAAEALTALKQYPGFNVEDLTTVRVEGFECRDALFAATDVRELHVYPALRGAGGQAGLFQIIIGAVLVVVGAILQFVPGAQPAGMFMMKAGAMLMLGGLIQLLAPQPQANTSGSTSQQSLFIPANQNTTKIGTPIKLIFGTIRTFGHYLSFNVDSKRLDDSTLDIAGYCNHTGAGQAQNCVIY
jgi:predicted phage tail protein